MIYPSGSGNIWWQKRQKPHNSQSSMIHLYDMTMFARCFPSSFLHNVDFKFTITQKEDFLQCVFTKNFVPVLCFTFVSRIKYKIYVC